MKIAVLAVALFVALGAGLCFSAEEPIIPGTYVNKQDTKEYLTLYPDGKFLIKQRKRPPEMENPFIEINGRYRVSGDSLNLELSDGGLAKGTLKDNKFEDENGHVWVKQGSEKTAPVERTKHKPIKF